MVRDISSVLLIWAIMAARFAAACGCGGWAVRRNLSLTAALARGLLSVRFFHRSERRGESASARAASPVCILKDRRGEIGSYDWAVRSHRRPPAGEAHAIGTA